MTEPIGGRAALIALDVGSTQARDRGVGVPGHRVADRGVAVPARDRSRARGLS
ncbi:hypothetical protein ACFZDG_04495 [Kitasatospora xanthocidica]|uniref:hypothetical protein n=1 Tax=Kitasatospora xanthocidica TaxID=83382 RepID=UPI0036E5BAD1